MKIKLPITVVFCFTALLGFSQIKFEEGYIITEAGLQKNVLILNQDWKINPTEIKYKTAATGEAITASIEQIKGFGVADLVYERATIDVDQSGDFTGSLGNQRNPNFLKETVFLQKILEGKANLYSYYNKRQLFFYRLDAGPVKPLIYKRYIVNNKIGVNSDFRQQLLSEFNCEGLQVNKVQYFDYKKSDLLAYLKEYNVCSGSENTTFERGNKSDFNVRVNGGVELASIMVNRGLNARGTAFNGLGYRFGLDLEYVFPFNKNKWAVYIEPAYRSFTSETQLTENFRADLQLTYSSFEIGVGAKHYMFLENPNYRIYVAAQYVQDFPIGSEVLFANTNRNMDPVLTEFKSSPNLNFGVGFEFKEKFQLGIRYGLSREVSGFKLEPENYQLDWRMNYSSIATTLAFKF